MERRHTPPPAVSGRRLSAPNSLDSRRDDIGGERRRRQPSTHAENKYKTATQLHTRNSIGNDEPRRRSATATPPYHANHRKRPLRPLGLPSLASPSGTYRLSNSPPQQQLNNPPNTQHPSKTSQIKGHNHHHCQSPYDERDDDNSLSNNVSTTIYRSAQYTQYNDNDTSSSSNNETNSNSIQRTAQKTALQCVDHASKRQAAAQAALLATSQISTSLETVMGDSNRALLVARQSKIEAENATLRAEAAVIKVKEVSDLTENDKHRAKLELDEANAQAEEAWEFLRRVKDTSKGHSSSGQRETSPLTARIESIVNGGMTGDSTKKQRSTEYSRTSNSSIHWDNTHSQIQMKKQSSTTRLHQSSLSSSGAGDTTTIITSTSKKQQESSLMIEPIRKYKGHTSPITQIAAVDSNQFISSSWDTTIRLWNATTGECIRTFRGHTDWVHAISVLADSKHFISGSDDRSIKLWNVGSDDCIRTFTGHTSFVKAVSPMEGDRFLSGSRDRTIRLWSWSSVTSGECLHTFSGHTDVVSALVSLDDTTFVSGSFDNSIKYWKDSESACIRSLTGHTGSIKTLSSVSEKEVLSGSDDRTIRLWNVSSGSCVREFGSKNSLVFSVSYICEGFFLSCSGNNIKLYHIPSGTCVKSYETPRISLAVVRLDDERFVTGSDQMLHLWKF